MADNPIYVGSGKAGKFGVKINICINDIAEYAKANIKAADNGKKYIRLEVNPRKSEDQYGNTHSVRIDTWKPEEKKEAKPDETPPQVKGGLDSESVPF